MAYDTSNSGFLNALNQTWSEDKNRASTGSSGYQWLTNAGNNFSSMFKNMVGRAPTADEAAQFYNNEIAANAGQYHDPNSAQRQNLNSYIKDFIGNNFQQQAQDVTNQKLQAQQGQANSLADLFRTQGRQAISSTESSLLDYQQKLFDRLRPSLITSLQSQGLLNTGGLNEAVAGAQKDLATSAQGSLLDAQLANEQQANAIQYGGASAPYQFQQAQILNQVPYLQQQSQNAMNNNFSSFMNQLQYQDQVGLQNNAARLQSDMQPGLLGRLGQNFTTSLGSSMGQGMGNWFNPSAYMGGQNSGATGAKAMLM